MGVKLETDDGIVHVIENDGNLYDLLIEYAGVDVADYVNERIDTLEGELGDVRDELEKAMDIVFERDLKDGIKDELKDTIVDLKITIDEMRDKIEELDEKVAELENSLTEMNGQAAD